MTSDAFSPNKKMARVLLVRIINVQAQLMCNHTPIFLSHSYIPINGRATQVIVKILDAVKERFKRPVKAFINKLRKKPYITDYGSGK